MVVQINSQSQNSGKDVECDMLDAFNTAKGIPYEQRYEGIEGTAINDTTGVLDWNWEETPTGVYKTTPWMKRNVQNRWRYAVDLSFPNLRAGDWTRQWQRFKSLSGEKQGEVLGRLLALGDVEIESSRDGQRDHLEAIRLNKDYSKDDEDEE
jgi:hypothetical protein